MEIKAKLKNVYQNIIDDCTEAVFEVPNAELADLNGKEIRLTIKEWKEKRSLDANSYCWVLCTKLAEKLKTSKDEVYEECIQKYGYTDDEPITITVKAEVDMSMIGGHWKYLKDSGDGKFKAYLRLKGSSEYNTKEMAHFLDMVIEDCKEQGIETMTENELLKLKETWKNNE